MAVNIVPYVRPRMRRKGRLQVTSKRSISTCTTVTNKQQPKPHVAPLLNNHQSALTDGQHIKAFQSAISPL